MRGVISGFRVLNKKQIERNKVTHLTFIDLETVFLQC